MHGLQIGITNYINNYSWNIILYQELNIKVIFIYPTGAAAVADD
jgi:hypothetical protein